MKFTTVNSTGLQEIAEFLRKNHIKGEMIAESQAMLLAWAQEAEFQLGEGNPASIEIRSFDSIHGHTQTFDISDAGLTVEKSDYDDEE